MLHSKSFTNIYIMIFTLFSLHLSENLNKSLKFENSIVAYECN